MRKVTRTTKRDKYVLPTAEFAAALGIPENILTVDVSGVDGTVTIWMMES